jgi:DNA polymerase-4
VVEREAKSVGAERTFAQDLLRWELPGALEDVLARALRRLARHGGGARTVTVKVRLSDFTTLTRSVTLAHPTAEVDQLRDAATAALTAANPVEPVRLLGVSLSGLTHWAQLRLPQDEADAADGLAAFDALAEAPSVTGVSDAPVPTTEDNHVSDDTPLAGAPTGLHVDDEPDDADDADDADEERLPAPLTLHTVAVGLDVSHPDHGAGWVVRSEDGVVTIRFEGPNTPPGPEHRFDIRRELLMRVAPPEPCPPPRLTSLASPGEVEAITAMLLPNEATP